MPSVKLCKIFQMLTAVLSETTLTCIRLCVCVCACMHACVCVSLSEYLVFILYYFQRFNEILDETQQQQQAFTDITE